MVSERIKRIRELYSKETTLEHSNQNGHTQYYSEWLELKLAKAESNLKALNSDYAKCANYIIGMFDWRQGEVTGKDIVEVLKRHFA